MMSFVYLLDYFVRPVGAAIGYNFSPFSSVMAKNWGLGWEKSRKLATMGRLPHLLITPHPALNEVCPCLNSNHGTKLTLVNSEFIHAKLLAPLLDEGEILMWAKSRNIVCVELKLSQIKIFYNWLFRLLNFFLLRIFLYYFFFIFGTVSIFPKGLFFLIIRIIGSQRHIRTQIELATIPGLNPTKIYVPKEVEYSHCYRQWLSYVKSVHC